MAMPTQDREVSVEKFHKQRAVNVTVPGSYVLPNWYDPQANFGPLLAGPSAFHLSA